METKPEYRPFQFRIADLLALMTIVAVLGSTSQLPVSLLHVSPVLAILYLARLRIHTLEVRPRVAIALYCLVLCLLEVYLYRKVTRDWGRGAVDPLAWWTWWGEIQGQLRAEAVNITGPILVFTVPTASFLFDTATHRRRSPQSFALRSLAEILIVIPVWTLAWVGMEVAAWSWMWPSR